jgi:hypothetical protein
MSSPSFAISVVVVSDYEGGEKTWDDERRILEALAMQDIQEPFEVVPAQVRVPEPHAVRELPGQAIQQQPGDISHSPPRARLHVGKADWPLVIVFLALARCLEVPGMLDALRGADRVRESSYR